MLELITPFLVFVFPFGFGPQKGCKFSSALGRGLRHLAAHTYPKLGEYPPSPFGDNQIFKPYQFAYFWFQVCAMFVNRCSSFHYCLVISSHGGHLDIVCALSPMEKLKNRPNVFCPDFFVRKNKSDYFIKLQSPCACLIFKNYTALYCEIARNIAYYSADEVVG